ncbi:MULTISPECIES: helix-turn-helix domain-containing protein [Methylosinus]|uniref:Chromosomal replication initiator DnaA n=1 Tax=Methylosinus trichosporium (strain ATCC 35070 / NCIMB 11131 / UNIQEM 75 / OB3b) TaxID=595536 RepID=A0A2D2D3B6_METT3|nr:MULTISPECIES: helix-turn-helix domain-containing protein [Methylosinus]ATQ69446.1 chromosomal replication initiator DnaA [Methylosinus trichosporium OB3b]OBS52957.1 chromosomal replication initiator DnaA [Methylosinus sp. 3S-1]
MAEKKKFPDAASRLCIAATAAARGVEPAAIASRRRGRAPIAEARQLAVYLHHVVYGASLSACARALRRDRASVRHACAVIEDRRDDPRFDRAVAALEAGLLAQRGLLLLYRSFLATPTIGDDR